MGPAQARNALLVGALLALCACAPSSPLTSSGESQTSTASSTPADLEWLLVPDPPVTTTPPQDITQEVEPEKTVPPSSSQSLPADNQVPQSILDELASLSQPGQTSPQPNTPSSTSLPAAPQQEEVERVDPDALRDSFLAGDSGQFPSQSTAPTTNTETFFTSNGTAVTYRFIDATVFPGPSSMWVAELTDGGSKVSRDSNADGASDIVVYDMDGDGVFDSREEDRNLDGRMDFQCLNHDLDPECEEFWTDTNHDGTFDANTFDTNGDGIPEEQDLSVFVPSWTIVRCDDINGDEAEDICHLDWDGDGIADSSEEMVVYWPPGSKEPSISFKTDIQLIAPPNVYSGS